MTITTGVCRMYNHIQVTPPHSEAERTAALGATYTDALGVHTTYGGQEMDTSKRLDSKHQE